ncbi:23S rRNA (adenine(1618)-N(6))-methyltransferase RlmF [Lewinella sp. JB7]|uniref:23S rRNA (adenine(1618)-N(6))-methyltransferase RlmF n=1 Tax=Lewinella sp. JB7 TaxID=2962887 RepID=UPI0020C96973|nr:23S rRNA (adenine(1618)-N(6))-methyltransferase RlmF [Lewinella sp. JB7]MCP9237749.1 23S rRNA (adenine(1618)-N(6))-methyltransferase RlmF [Lewinella sp. JB7]
MHPKNRYREPHDFVALRALEPELDSYFITTPDGRTSLDFSQPRAVYLLNRTLLLRDYGLKHWDIPQENLTPPIPGRLDYIHALHELHPVTNRVLDIGTGASLIYPILGVGEYGWSFVGTDISARSVKVARALIKFNPVLKKVEVREQSDPGRVFAGVIGDEERFDVTMCNPPFFTNRQEARKAAGKKWAKLDRADGGLSFGGADEELWTPGGEPRFLRTMVEESVDFAGRVGWFTTLVSKGGYLKPAVGHLARVGAREWKTLPLAQGNKRSRLLAWRY